MSDTGHHADFSAADQFGLGLLADGNDLFDLGHVEAAVTTPAWTMTPATAQGSGLDADLLAFDLVDHDGSGHISAGHEGHAPYLQLAAADPLPLVFPLPHPVTDGQDDGHGPAVQGAADHALALSLHDILADAASDLASFETASGGTGSGGHAPMGSGLYVPFHDNAALAGFSELHVISQG